jgi:hypothetical protein
MSITKRSARSTVIVHEADFDTTIRLSLGAPSYGSGSDRIRSCDEIGTGVFARALWVGRKHVVLLTYSQWVDRNGMCTGDQYRLCNVDDVRTIRQIFGDGAAERALDTLRIPVVTVDGTVAA